MKIVLTDIPKCCPEQLPEGYCLEGVSINNLTKYDGNKEVEIVLCSRGLAKDLYRIDLPSCKLVQLFSVGYDNVDLDMFKEKKIPLCNAAGIYDNVLAEYVVYAMLLYAKRFHHNLKNRMFRPFRNYHYMTELAGKTVGIMGCGKIGSAVARCLSGFKMTIVGYAKSTDEKEGFERIFHKVNIKEFFSCCDFIVNTMPHDESTIGLIDLDVLESAKSNMTFINIGRESIFWESDFYKYMKTHPEATAILDMFEIIPNPLKNKYRRLSNVLVFPRIAAISQESEKELKHLLSNNIAAALEGKELKNQIV